MKNRLILLVILLQVFANILEGYAQENCDLKKDQDGIKVFTCKTDSSEFKTIRAQFKSYASIDNYLDLVRDINNYKNWHYKSIEPKLLKRVSDYEYVYYTQIEAPWPVQNRDMVLHLRLIKKNEELSVFLESMPEYLPEDDEYVRVPYSKSIMHLVPDPDGSGINVEFTILADPGGSLPIWVVNLVSAQGPYETFKQMKEILE